VSVVLISSDMMVSSRVRSTSQAAGAALQIVVSPADLAVKLGEETRLVIVDLSQPQLNLPDVIAAVRESSPAARIVAFGPHVADKLLALARKAGCDEVMTNGEFHREQLALIGRLA